jgi:hypothetical protein
MAQGFHIFDSHTNPSGGCCSITQWTRFTADKCPTLADKFGLVLLGVVLAAGSGRGECNKNL